MSKKITWHCTTCKRTLKPAGNWGGGYAKSLAPTAPRHLQRHNDGGYDYYIKSNYCPGTGDYMLENKDV